MPISDPELAIAAAQAGATIVQSHASTDLQHISKGPNDFTTQADIASETAMRHLIHQERPTDVFIGEESGTHAPAGKNRRTWLVDPLCGTLNYVAGGHDVAVNIALQDVDGTAIAAAVADPFRGEIFWTDQERAYVRRHGIDVLLAPTSPPETALVEVNFDFGLGNSTALAMKSEFREMFRLRVVSSTIAVPWVAAGRRAAYVSEGDFRGDLHFAAGIAICKAAGCVVTGNDGQPLYSGAGGLLIAADEETHHRLLSMMQS